jgi:hypothetical protein
MKFTRSMLQLLKDAIRVGDERLADHIAQQIASVHDALIQADRLERERIGSVKDMATERVSTQDRALRELTVNTERRFEQLEKIAAGHITIEEYDRRHSALEDRMSSFERWRTNLSGRYVAYGVIGAILIAVAAGFITHVVVS